MIYRLPPLNSLRVFEAAARRLSFKEAAAELHITQAAVSHQVKSLEEYLGVQRFRRAARGVQLTEAARACLRKVREGFDALAAAVESIRERGGEAERVITAPPGCTARRLRPSCTRSASGAAAGGRARRAGMVFSPCFKKFRQIPGKWAGQARFSHVRILI